MADKFVYTDEGLEPEPGVPLPPPRAKSRPYRVQWDRFEVGDSVFLAGYRQGRMRNDENGKPMVVLNMSYIRRAAPNFRFTARSVEQNGMPGLRVWRVE